MATADIQQIDTKTPEMDHLLEIFGMAHASSIIYKALDLNIFELLYLEKSPITAKELADKNKYKPEPLARFLNCLTALKFVKKCKSGGKVVYSNTKAGDLLSTSCTGTFASIPDWHKYYSTVIYGLVDTIKITDEVKERGPEEEENWDDYPADLGEYQGFHNLLAPQAKQLVTTYDLSGHKSCIDLGGGTGAIAFELRRQYPQMDVTVFEMKNVIELAKEKFVPGNEHLGVKFMTGDFFKTPFPSVDLFIFCRVLRNMGDKELNDLLSKCFAALNPGGAVLCFEQMMNEEKDGSISATIWDLVNMSWNAGIPTPSEYRSLFEKNGFKDIKFTYTQDWNEYDIIYAKKL